MAGLLLSEAWDDSNELKKLVLIDVPVVLAVDHAPVLIKALFLLFVLGPDLEHLPEVKTDRRVGVSRCGSLTIHGIVMPHSPGLVLIFDDTAPVLQFIESAEPVTVLVNQEPASLEVTAEP